jgi:hypothetical protein
MNTAIEDRIRTRAYEIWEGEGCPVGREIDHWLQAVQELAEERATVGAVVARPKKAKAPASAPVAAAPAAAPAKSRSRTTRSA